MKMEEKQARHRHRSPCDAGWPRSRLALVSMWVVREAIRLMVTSVRRMEFSWEVVGVV
jgi:hypothetical protein